MSDAPVELVVPFYGSPAYLQLAVRSVLAQDVPDWRLTVVEDGPQRGFATHEWLASLQDPRIRYFGSTDRLGIARNFQRSLDLATGEYVVLLGCDDLLLPPYVRTVRKLAEMFPGAAILQPGVEVIDGTGRAVTPLGDRVKSWLRPRGKRIVEMSGEQALTRLLHGNWLYFPSLCWRRDAIAVHGFRTDLPTALDLDLIARVVMSGGTIAYDPRVVFRYRRHAASASSRTAAARSRFAEEALVHAEIARRAHEIGWHRARRAAVLRTTSRLHHALVAGSMLARDFAA